MTSYLAGQIKMSFTHHKLGLSPTQSTHKGWAPIAEPHSHNSLDTQTIVFVIATLRIITIIAITIHIITILFILIVLLFFSIITTVTVTIIILFYYYY